jgi:hypothetical protein
MTTIRAKDGWSYTLTDTDRVMLAVAAKYEGGDDAGDLFWVYANRLAKRGFRNGSMAQLISAHSQPTNPRWRRDGEFCRPGGQYHGTEHCSVEKLARRDRAAADIAGGLNALAFDDRGARIVRQLRDWEAGRVPKQIRNANNFATAAMAQNYVNRNGGEITHRAGNWFLVDREGLSWPDDFVTIQSSGTLGYWGPLFFVGSVVGGMIAWDVSRRNR